MEQTKTISPSPWLPAATHVAAALAGAAVAVAAILTGARPVERVRTVQVPVRVPVLVPAAPSLPAPSATPAGRQAGGSGTQPAGASGSPNGPTDTRRKRTAPAAQAHFVDPPLFRPPVALHPLLLPPLKMAAGLRHRRRRRDETPMSPDPSTVIQPARSTALAAGADAQNSPLVRALIAADRGDVDTAIAGLERLTSDFPSDASLALLLANVYDRKRLSAATPDEEARWRAKAMAERDRALSLLDASQHPRQPPETALAPHTSGDGDPHATGAASPSGPGPAATGPHL